MYRSHTCGELTNKNIGEIVTLSGWVNKYRNLGGLLFVDIRDKYGITQLIFNPEQKDIFALAEKLRAEFVIKIEGEVVERQTANKEILTGNIEIKVNSLEILNESEVPPFEISDEELNVNEELRLKYRYLDLRRKKIQKILTFRAEMIKFIRNYMDNTGYTEISTPLLTASSPEGARDFLVPSRMHPGKFYALPQAPQQYKQLLMVGGLDKYYQIAPCMRDEDARADRSPGEFYQLDVECSFKTSEEFFVEQEKLWIELTEKLTNKKVMHKPFPRIPYKEVMDKYGSDRPDLRYGLEFHDITGFAKNSKFSVFNKAKVVKGLCVPNGANEFSRKDIEGELTDEAKKKGAKGLATVKVKDNTLDGGIAKFFTEAEKEYLVNEFKAKDGDLLCFVADEYDVVVNALGLVRKFSAEKLKLNDPNIIAWCWVIDFPMYEKNEKTDKIDFMHNPFSMPRGEMDALENQDPLEILADQYDIIANGFELSSGAVRNNKPEIMYKAFEIAGYTKEAVDKKFKHMIEAFKYGAPPHCGYAPGIERLIMVLLGEDNIRETLAFPKNSKAQDAMMGAPSEVDPEQLEELGIKIIDKK